MKQPVIAAIADKDGYTQHSLTAGIGFQPQKISNYGIVRFTKINSDLDQGAFVDELDYRMIRKVYELM